LKKIEIPNITFTSYPGARDCLKNLPNFYCRSDIHPGFFNQLSQICHNIQYINITFENKISYGLKDLISVQKNLKFFIMRIYNCEDLTNLIHLLSKFSDTLIKYELNEQLFGGNYNMPLSFIAKYTNLKELVLSFDIYSDSFKCFKNLEFVTFPQLEILEFPFIHPRIEELIKFLENNGKNLKKFRIYCIDDSLYLAIANFCSNLRRLFTMESNNLELLKKIFNSCKHLKNIGIRCGDNNLNDKEVLETITNYSSRNFYQQHKNYSRKIRSIFYKLEKSYTTNTNFFYYN